MGASAGLHRRVGRRFSEVFAFQYKYGDPDFALFEKRRVASDRKIRLFYEGLCRRFIVQLPCEIMNNKVKANVSVSRNTKCTPQRAWAVIVDNDVLGKEHKYKTVDRHTETVDRHAKLTKDYFHAPVQPKKMTKSFNALSLADCVGAEEAYPLVVYFAVGTRSHASDHDGLASQHAVEQGRRARLVELVREGVIHLHAYAV